MSSHKKRFKTTFILVAMYSMFLVALLGRGYVPFERTGDNFFRVFVDGSEVGALGSMEQAEELLVQARRSIASQYDKMVYMEADMTFEGEELLYGRLDSEDTVREKMEAALRSNVYENLNSSYTIKIEDYMVSLDNADEVKTLLQAAVDKYNEENNFHVDLVRDNSRAFQIQTCMVNKTVEQIEEEMIEEARNDSMSGGIQTVLASLGSHYAEERELSFDEYELGVRSISFGQKVEIAEACVPVEGLTDLETAIADLTMEQEVPEEYTVESGDTLSGIAIKLNQPVERLIEMNSDQLTDINSVIRVGQKLITTVPEPPLRVEHVARRYYEEIYDADVIYVDNDSWYTTQTVVLQQPSAGFRKIVVDESFENDLLKRRDILKEEIVMEAVPKIVERGTKIPPTYIKPVSGGRFSSGFGKRKAPTKGASTYHKGVDWAVPTGTPVYASCGGTVVKAGWSSGYGYAVFIDHSDGRQTRYGHNSKVLVKVGDTVKQGQKIALSGNTGITSGPHVHFEILIGGKQVNPLKYLQ